MGNSKNNNRIVKRDTSGGNNDNNNNAQLPKSILNQKSNHNHNSLYSQQGLYESVKMSHQKNDFLNKEIKSKKILCQKSLVLTVTQCFVQQLQQNKVKMRKGDNKEKGKNANKHKRHSDNNNKNSNNNSKNDK